MLKEFRRHHIRAVFWGLVVVVVPSFLLWGVASYLRSQRENTYLYLNNKPVSYTDFKNYVTTATIYYRLVFPNRQDFYAKVNQDTIRSKALQLILLLWKARKDGMEVSDRELAQFIERSFAPGGKFDKKWYYRFVANNFAALGMTPEIFERHLRRILLSEKVLDKYTYNVKITDKEVKDLYKEENEKAKISYVFLDFSSVLKDISVTDDEITSFYTEHKDSFRSPPSVRIKYIVLNPEHDRKVIAKLNRLLPHMRSIDEIAQRFSLEVKESPYFGRKSPLKDIEDKDLKINDLAFSLPEGKLSPLIEVNGKYVVFEKTEEKKGDILPLTSVKAKIVRKIKLAKAEDKLKKKADAVLQEIGGDAAKWEEVMQEHGLEIKTSKYFTRFQPIEGIGYEEPIVKAAFSMKKGQLAPKPFVTDKGVYLIKIEDLISFDEKEFTKKKEEYFRRLRQQKIFLKTVQFFSELQKEAHLRMVTTPRR